MGGQEKSSARPGCAGRGLRRLGGSAAARRGEAFEKQAGTRRESTRTGRKNPGLQGIQRAVRREAAAGNDHVVIRIVGHGRAPWVEHGGQADAGAEMLRIGRDDTRAGSKSGFS